IYFSSVSGKADDFSMKTAKVAADGRRVRFMIVADVAIGNPFVTTETNFQDTTRPPPGYDSIVGKPGPNLKYDELIVYDEAATLPTYIVSYYRR
ncbi:unnamed protein product, partial [Ectocarpus fasciculatus]